MSSYGKMRRLQSWVESNHDRIKTRTGTLAELHVECQREMGEKVSYGMMCDAMRDAGLPTKRTSEKRQRELELLTSIERLEDRVRNLLRLLRQTRQAGQIPITERAEVFPGLSAEVDRELDTPI